MNDSERVPGYPMRYFGAVKVEDRAKNTMHKFDVSSDGERGIPVRTAKPEDAERLGRTKPSPLT